LIFNQLQFIRCTQKDILQTQQIQNLALHLQYSITKKT